MDLDGVQRRSGAPHAGRHRTTSRARSKRHRGRRSRRVARHHRDRPRAPSLAPLPAGGAGRVGRRADRAARRRPSRAWTLPDADVTHVARAAAEVARGIVAGDDVAAEVSRLLEHWFPVARPQLTRRRSARPRRHLRVRARRATPTGVRVAELGSAHAASPTACSSAPARRTRTPRRSPRSDARCSGTWIPSSSRSSTRRWRACAPCSAPRTR